nr:hypothetical protein [Tanacetum cinerariifolium]
MRIEQYIQIINYALWEVIENGATLPKTQLMEGVTIVMPITTVGEKTQTRLEVKDRSTLMMGILNEHQLKFNFIKDAKQLLEAVEKRFGKMDDLNITIRENNRLEEEKALKCGEEYNWETAKYGKIWYDEDVHDLRYVETEFLAIVYNDALTSEVTPSYEPTISPFSDNKINFRISFDESNDEDYTVVFDKKSFSYKIISVNDLKTDSKIDNDKVSMPLFLSPEPTVNYIDDLDFLKDFEKEFTAIVYNVVVTSKIDFLTEPTISPGYKNNNKINIEHSSGDLSCEPLPIVIKIDTQWSNKLLETSHDTIIKKI